MKRLEPGFTLLELLIVVAMLTVFALASFSLYTGSQQKGQDGRRKQDLAAIARALEMYANDAGASAGNPYPDGQSGAIVGCGTDADPVACVWGSPWTRGATGVSVTYMARLPKDPSGSSYCYERSANGYKLYANIKSSVDPDYDAALTCGGAGYTFVLLSANSTPTPKP